jgi:hypothetical protein
VRGLCANDLSRQSRSRSRGVRPTNERRDGARGLRPVSPPHPPHPLAGDVTPAKPATALLGALRHVERVGARSATGTWVFEAEIANARGTLPRVIAAPVGVQVHRASSVRAVGHLELVADGKQRPLSVGDVEADACVAVVPRTKPGLEGVSAISGRGAPEVDPGDRTVPIRFATLTPPGPPLPPRAGEGEPDARRLLPPRPRFEGEGGRGGEGF